MYRLIPAHRHFSNNENPVDWFEDSIELKFESMEKACDWVSYITKSKAAILNKNNTNLIYAYAPFGLTLNGRQVFAEVGAIIDEEELSNDFLNYYLDDKFMDDLIEEDKENHKPMSDCIIYEAYV